MNLVKKSQGATPCLSHRAVRVWSTLNLMVFMIFSQFSFAENPIKKSDNNKTLSDVVINLLDQPDFKNIEDQEVIVFFEINKQNEIVLTSVNTSNFFLKRFIMSRLNYEKLNADFNPTKNNYKVLIQFKKSS